MPKCPKCGQIQFYSWEGYQAHMLQYHHQRIVIAIKPVRTTSRTHAQIVADAEKTWLKPYIVALEKPMQVLPVTQHAEDCNCTPCFNVKLDALVLSSSQNCIGGDL